MRLLYVEATIDHHSLPLARCLRQLLPPDDFAYAGLRPLSGERNALGWNSGELDRWMTPVWRSAEDSAAYRNWWEKADIVLCSPKEYQLMERRIRNERRVFYATERWFKPPVGRVRLIHPLWAWKAERYRRLARTKFMNYLAIGHYAALDMQWFVSMPERMWQWGYFTEALASALCPVKEPGMRVLWAGRMLEWKRINSIISAFSALVKSRKEAKLTLIGDGPQRDQLSKLAARLLPASSYEILPPTSPAAVREHMRRSHIYVLSSSAYEGWGAVINEAMTEGCAVVASRETGAGRTLIKNRVNGMLFPSGDWDQLGRILCELAENDGFRTGLAQAGKATLDNLWAPKVAAERFLAVADALLSGKKPPSYSEGPMQICPSPAKG